MPQVRADEGHPAVAHPLAERGEATSGRGLGVALARLPWQARRGERRTLRAPLSVASRWRWAFAILCEALGSSRLPEERWRDHAPVPNCGAGASIGLSSDSVWGCGAERNRHKM